jgi:uncharacterized membrane protein
VSPQELLAAASALLGAAVGGVYLGFSWLVMPGLVRRPDAEALAAMQSINRSIRPPFFLLFVGSALVAVASAVAEFVAWDGAVSVWRVAGDVLVVAHLVITAAFHIPRNTRIEALDPTRPADLEEWRVIARQWTRGNHVRGLAAFVGAGILIATLLG